MISALNLGEPRILFQSQDLSNLIQHQLREALNAVHQIPPDVFLNTPTEDIIAGLLEKHSFEPPVLRRAEAYIDGPHEVEIRRSDFGGEIRLRGTFLGLIVPFDGDGGMFYMNPNRYGGAPRGNLNYNNLILTMQGENLQPDQVNRQLEARLNEIEDYLGYQRSMADGHRQSLPPRLRPEIEARKQKLLDSRKMVAGLAFPIRARQDAPKTYVAPVVRKKVIAPPAVTASLLNLNQFSKKQIIRPSWG